MAYNTDLTALTLMVLSNNETRLERLLAWAKAMPFDRIRIWVDSKARRATRLLAEDAGVLEDVIEVTTIDAALSYIHGKLDTEWGLHLGDDEIIEPSFVDVKRYLEGPADAYALPRYNLFGDADHYIKTQPWYPDWAVRLFRKGVIEHRGEVHEGPIVNGRLLYAPFHIYHFDFLEQLREEREEKWAKYEKQGVVAESLKRGLSEDHYRRWALPEEFEFEVGAL